MLKTIALIRRRADHDREAFRDHYERTHSPLAVRHIRSFGRYVRNHVLEEVAGEPWFDVATEFWFETGADAKHVMDVLESPVGEEIRADEASFMERERNTSFPVRELVLAGAETDEELGRRTKVDVFLRRPEGAGREAFLESYERGPLAALLKDAPPLRCTQNAALGEDAPWDCVTMLWYPADAPLHEAVRSFRPEAREALVLRVSEDETPREQLRD